MNAPYSFLMIFILFYLIGNLSSKTLQLKGVKNTPYASENDNESLIFLSKNHNGNVRISSSYVNPYLVHSGSNDFSLHEGAKIVHQVVSKPVKYPRKTEAKETKEEGFLLNSESNSGIN